MPRRAEIQPRPVISDPIYDSQLVTQLMNRVMLDGKKSVAEKVVYGALADDRQRVVHDALGGRLLAVQHHLVDDLLDELGAVDGVRVDRPDRGGGAARHYLALTPYCERAFLRSDTPAASSVPRTTL